MTQAYPTHACSLKPTQLTPLFSWTKTDETTRFASPAPKSSRNTRISRRSKEVGLSCSPFCFWSYTHIHLSSSWSRWPFTRPHKRRLGDWTISEEAHLSLWGKINKQNRHIGLWESPNSWRVVISPKKKNLLFRTLFHPEVCIEPKFLENDNVEAATVFLERYSRMRFNFFLTSNWRREHGQQDLATSRKTPANMDLLLEIFPAPSIGNRGRAILHPRTLLLGHATDRLMRINLQL